MSNGEDRKTSLMRQAARCYVKAEMSVEAALCFARAGDWREASRCYLDADQPEAAASGLEQAGDLLEAGWLLAHHTHRQDRARAMLAHVMAQDDTTATLALELARARCDFPKETKRLASVLRHALTRLPTLTPTIERDRLIKWAMDSLSLLARPDLQAAWYAVLVNMNVPGANEGWERWSQENLGMAANFTNESP